MDTATPRRFRFTLRDLFLLVLVVALGVGWFVDHWRLMEQLKQNSTRTERRYVTKSTSGAAKVGMTQDEVRWELGAPHYEARGGDATPYWLYHYAGQNSGSLRIDFGYDDLVEQVTDLGF